MIKKITASCLFTSLKYLLCKGKGNYIQQESPPLPSLPSRIYWCSRVMASSRIYADITRPVDFPRTRRQKSMVSPSTATVVRLDHAYPFQQMKHSRHLRVKMRVVLVYEHRIWIFVGFTVPSARPVLWKGHGGRKTWRVVSTPWRSRGSRTEPCGLPCLRCWSFGSWSIVRFLYDLFWFIFGSRFFFSWLRVSSRSGSLYLSIYKSIYKSISLSPNGWMQHLISCGHHFFFFCLSRLCWFFWVPLLRFFDFFYQYFFVGENASASSVRMWRGGA